MRMKPKPNPKAPTSDDWYDAYMIHHYRDPELFVEHFKLAGIDPAGFTLREFCELHTKLWSDPIVQGLMRSRIDAAPKLEFKVSEFLSQPWESNYWKRALRDSNAYEVFIQIMNEMTEPEKIALRARIKKGAV